VKFTDSGRVRVTVGPGPGKGGTGLGLAICKHLATLMEGSCCHPRAAARSGFVMSTQDAA
jgi:signal transduction histidine kinase